MFEWTQEAQQVFEELKQWLTSAPILMMPNQAKPFQIKCDASKYASGAVLTQLDNNGDRHPAAFLSKTFNETKLGAHHNYVSTQTIRTLHISDQHRSLIVEKPDGHCTSQNLMSN